jgi:hypothetical protein
MLPDAERHKPDRQERQYSLPAALYDHNGGGLRRGVGRPAEGEIVLLDVGLPQRVSWAACGESTGGGTWKEGVAGVAPHCTKMPWRRQQPCTMEIMPKTEGSSLIILERVCTY